MRELEKETEDAIKRKEEQSRIEIENQRFKAWEAEVKAQKIRDEARGCLRYRGLRRLACFAEEL